MKKLLFLTLLISHCALLRAQVTRTMTAPGGSVRLVVEVQHRLRYSVYFKDQLIVSPSDIDMTLGHGPTLSAGLSRSQFSEKVVNETIVSPVPEKRKVIPDRYRELKIKLRNGFSVTFRVYDDGVAYRIGTAFPDSITVRSETAHFRFPENHPMYFPEMPAAGGFMDVYHTSFEELYQYKPLNDITHKSLFFNPVLLTPENSPKIAITESDLEDYPGMFLTGTGAPELSARFAHYPAEEKETNELYSTRYVSRRADYLARTKGTRQFPWRVLMIAPEDKDLPANDLVYRLASPSRVADVSWVKPGKATDEWIITSNIFNVPFKSGINTATYKYYIDFAKRFGFERIMMDAGWSDNNDLFKIHPDINMEEIMAYAKSRGIGVSMWTLALTLEKQLEPALAQFSKWGVDFIMTDFINRDDQKAVQFYYKVAEACARHKLMLMFHGSFKPAGFNRTFPHAIAREAVLGSEYNMWSAKAAPDHNLLLPFIRMLAGPLDYEPGMLHNATPKGFHPMPENVMSLTTRTQQLAMFVVYESPVQFFAGNPSQGLNEPAFMELLGSIPTVWDDTKILDARVGDYIVTARRKGTDWYIGAMTDSTARDLDIPLRFLGEGRYEATRCEDGINADRYPADYRLSKTTITGNDRLKIRMAPGGGYVMKLIFKK